MNEELKDHLKSAGHTFISTFLLTFVALISQIPVDTFWTLETWSTSALVGLAMTAVRAGWKAGWVILSPYLADFFKYAVGKLYKSK